MNSVMAVSGVLFLAYFVAFAASAVLYSRYNIDPSIWWAVAFTPFLAVLYLMIWVLFPIDHELRRKDR